MAKTPVAILIGAGKKFKFWPVLDVTDTRHAFRGKLRSMRLGAEFARDKIPAGAQVIPPPGLEPGSLG